MEKNINSITCPNCGAAINVSEILAHQLDEDYRKKYQADIAREKKQYEERLAGLEAEKLKLDADQKQIQKRIQESVNKKLKSAEEAQRQRISEELQKEQADQLKNLMDELDEKSRRLQELNKTKAEIERLKREKIEERAQWEAEAEKKANQLVEKERLKIQKKSGEEVIEKLALLKEENRKKIEENKNLKKRELELLQKEQQMQEKNENLELEYKKQLLSDREKIAEDVRQKEKEKNDLTFRELKKQIDDQKKLVAEMQRKAEQGSMQLQGEVQELALEDILRTAFPFDSIQEVIKGVRGADVLHTIRNTRQEECGKILYESKRTKSFSDGWIEKLKNDQRNQQAEVAVIVTDAMPRNMQHFGQISGIWICSFPEVEALVFVLREMLLKLHLSKAAQENRGDKMSMLYTYLTSAEFTQRVEAIVDGFSTMKLDLDKEKRAMQKIWKIREKQIEKVIDNTIDMYGAIKGIAGNAIGTVSALELPAGDD